MTLTTLFYLELNMNHPISWVVSNVNEDGVRISEYLKKGIWILDPHGIRQPVVLEEVTT